MMTAYQFSYVVVPVAVILATLAVLLAPSLRKPAPPAGHDLKKRLHHARMSKMLRRMGVSPSTYLQRLSAGLVASQLDTCTACPHQFLCDQALRAAAHAPGEDLSFCPNRAAVLERVRRAAVLERMHMS